jgi:hypothetical protein
MNAAPKPHTLGERFQIGASLIAPVALLWLASRKGWLPLTPWWCLAAMPAVLVVGMLLPGAFAGWHRGLTALQSWIGRRLVALLLGFVFVLVLVPVGLLLRARGKSFIDGPRADSYWKPARPPGSLRDQF